MAGVIPSPTVKDSEHRIAYAVLAPRQTNPTNLDRLSAPHRTGDSLQDDWEVTGIITLLPEKEATLSPGSSAQHKLTLELGYLFLPSYWGYGYATESGRALLDEYRRVLSRTSLAAKVEFSAHVHADNLPSIRVLEKLGFLEVNRSEDEGLIFLDGKERRKIVAHFKRV
jgi:RimJ/RimL family protein N-acetyltransferase